MAIEDNGIIRPANLGRSGTDLWLSVVNGEYELDPGQVRLLTDAAREADLIDRLQAEIDAGAPFLVKGSMGQQVANPLIAEIRQHRATLKGLLSALHLGEDARRNRGFHAQRGTGTVSDAARRAARMRWGSGGVG
jgi:hypothetical protein